MASAATTHAAPAAREPHVPPLFTSPGPIRDPLATPSSELQDATVKQCLPYLCGAAGRLDYNARGVPRLAREKHAAFLRKNLGALPAPYIGADASRPWILYWCLAGLTLLGEDVSAYGEGLVETARTMQNATGGFGGGHGQTSHLATTYAVVLALTVMGGEEAYEVIDRRAMWKWLCSLKQPTGGFQMSLGGEVDVRYVRPGLQFPCILRFLKALPPFLLLSRTRDMSRRTTRFSYTHADALRTEAHTAQPWSSRYSGCP